MLLFAKISLNSFIYDLIKTLHFPSKNLKKNYDKHMIRRTFSNHLLIDTDSTSVLFIFICKPESSVTDSNFRNLLFGVVDNNEISNRFNTFHEFWEKFDARNKSLTRKLGYYEIEQIGNPCQVTIAVNPKEYFECFKSDETNKKHKGLKKGSAEMNYEFFSKRSYFLRDIESFGQLQK